MHRQVRKTELTQLEIKTWFTVVQETQNDAPVGISELGIGGDISGFPTNTHVNQEQKELKRALTRSPSPSTQPSRLYPAEDW